MLLVVMGAGAVMYVASAVLIPLTLGFLLHLLLRPIVRRLEPWGVPHGRAAVLVGGGFSALVLSAVIGTGTTATAFIDDVPGLIERAREQYQSVAESMPEVTDSENEGDDGSQGGDSAGGAAEDGETEASEEGGGGLLATQPADVANAIVRHAGPVLLGMLITFVSLMFLLIFGDVILEKIVKLLPQWHEKKEAVQAMWELERDLSTYLLTLTAINVGIALVVFPVLWSLGMPQPWLWAVLAGLLNYIPYLGPVIYLVLLTLASFISFSGWGGALMPPIAFLCINTVEAYLITPTLMGKRFELNPLVVFVWLVLWGWLWGVAGTLLAVPILVCFRIICSHVPDLYPLGMIIADERNEDGEGQAEQAARAVE